MAMDGLALKRIVGELQTIVGGKIDKVQQPEKDVLLLTVRTNVGTQRILIVTHAENGRLQRTEAPQENPVTAPAFCMLLRKHILGGRITAVEQIGPDRACAIHILARDEMMDAVPLKLAIELTGKHSNLSLVGQDGKIIDCLRRISPSETNLRVMLPGFSYLPPPDQGKLDPFQATQADLAAVFSAESNVRALTDAYAGIGRGTATAMLGTCVNAKELHALLQSLADGTSTPSIVYDLDDAPVAVLPFLPKNMQGRTERRETLSEALDDYYAARDAIVRTRRHGAALRRTAEHALGRAQNRRQALWEAMQNGERLETLRLNGELILANLHRAKAGMQQLVADNYYADPPETVVVPLDPALSMQENAKKYFKQYRKGKLARQYAEGELGNTDEEIAYLESVLESIGRAETIAELEQIRLELVQQRFVKPERKAARASAKPSASQPMRFCSSSGIPILVGRNNLQNDRLTLKTAAGNNLWLHAKNMAGSHVIVDCDGMPDDQTLLEAATLAAYYSKGQSAPLVAVDYTARKNVKKPASARPGMVVYQTNHTIHVAPDRLLVQSLQAPR